MPRFFAALLVLFTLAAAIGSAQPAPCDARPGGEPLAVAKEWWRAFAVGEVPYLEQTSAQGLTFTANTGRTFSRSDVLTEAATHNSAVKIGMEWTDESVRQASPSVAVITARVSEMVGARPAAYRYLAVLECSGGKWQMLAGQSTRDLAPTPRVAAVDEKVLQELAGRYRTGAGKIIQVVARDSALVLIDPSGAETPMEPIGPALFEARGVSFQGLIRFAFSRDASGKVTALTRLTSDVLTFPRVD